MKALVLSFLILQCSCSPHPYPQGEILYKNFCANCHMEDGNGLGKLIPPLAESDYIKNNQDHLACIIRYGIKGEIIVNGIIYNQEMPGEKVLTDFEINNIINYINYSWGNQIGFKKLPETQLELENCDSLKIFFPEHVRQ
jgi:mono/diheme cytochrome c family protein